MIDGIDGNMRVNRSYDEYNSKPITGQDDEFKKKLKMNSILTTNEIAYIPQGGIGSLLNGSQQNTTGATQA